MEESKNSQLMYLTIVAIVAIVGIIAIYMVSLQKASYGSGQYSMMSKSPRSYNSMPQGMRSAMNSSKKDMAGAANSRIDTPGPDYCDGLNRAWDMVVEHRASIFYRNGYTGRRPDFLTEADETYDRMSVDDQKAVDDDTRLLNYWWDRYPECFGR